MSEYQVIVKSKLYGRESFTYDSLDDALEGMDRLIRRGLAMGDDVARWYRIKEKKRTNANEDPSLDEVKYA